MIAFIEAIITLLMKLIFVERLAKENEELKKEVQQLKQEKQEFKAENRQLKQEKEELAQAKQQLEQNNQDLIQQNFNLVRKYVAVNQQKEKLIKELARSKFPDINQKFDPEDLDVIDQLLREFNCAEELTI